MTPSTPKQRVMQELLDLKTKKEKLGMFLLTKTFQNLTDRSKELLLMQLNVIKQYIDILEQRLSIWEDL